MLGERDQRSLVIAAASTERRSFGVSSPVSSRAGTASPQRTRSPKMATINPDALRGRRAMIILGLILAFILLFVVLLWLIHTIVGIVLFFTVAGLCAAAAEYILGHREGLGETVLIGLIGAALGAVVAHLFHLPTLIVIGRLPIVWTIVGSGVVVWLLKLARPESGRLRRLR